MTHRAFSSPLAPITQTSVAADLGVKFFPLYDVSEFFRQDLDVIVVSVSILAFEEVRLG